MNIERDRNTVAELSYSLRREVTLLLTVIDDILDKFALLEEMIPNASQLVIDRSSSSHFCQCDIISGEYHSPSTSSVLPDDCSINTDAVSPHDIGTVDISEFTIVKPDECEEHNEPDAEVASSLCSSESGNNTQSFSEKTSEIIVGLESLMRRKLFWVINKLFPSQQRFDPEDPFIRKVLIDMGFSDDEQNIRALRENDGIVPRALDSLLSNNDHHSTQINQDVG